MFTEATQFSDDGQGYPLTPGVFTPEQIAGWKKITDAVHAKVRWIYAKYSKLQKYAYYKKRAYSMGI